MKDITVAVGHSKIPVIFYQGKPVITFTMMDQVHDRPDGTAGRNFRKNQSKLVEGEDYFRRNSSEARSEFNITAPNGLVLLAETGYLMLVKSFTDDLAWQVQRQLVRGYFAAKDARTMSPFERFDHNKYWALIQGRQPSTAAAYLIECGLKPEYVAMHSRKRFDPMLDVLPPRSRGDTIDREAVVPRIVWSDLPGVKFNKQGMASLNAMFRAFRAPANKSPQEWFRSGKGAAPLITYFGDTRVCYVEEDAKYDGKGKPVAHDGAYFGGLRRDIWVDVPLALAYSKWVSDQAYWEMWNTVWRDMKHIGWPYARDFNTEGTAQ